MKIFLKVVFKNQVNEFYGASRKPTDAEMNEHKMSFKKILGDFNGASFKRVLNPNEVGKNEYGYGILIDKLHPSALLARLQGQAQKLPNPNPQPARSPIIRAPAFGSGYNRVGGRSAAVALDDEAASVSSFTMPAGIMPFSRLEDIG